jgi:hypothetical protein
MLLSQADYARARGVSKQAIGQAVRCGKIRLYDGKIDPRQADISWGGGKQDEVAVMPSGQRSALPSPQESRAAKTAYEARLAKLEYDQRSGKLVEVAVVNSFVAGMVMKARDDLSRIGAEIADKLASEHDAVKCRALVDDRIFQVLANLRQYQAA